MADAKKTENVHLRLTPDEFALLKEQFGAERKAGAAAKRKPLNDSEVADAAKLLSEKWSGKLF